MFYIERLLHAEARARSNDVITLLPDMMHAHIDFNTAPRWESDTRLHLPAIIPERARRVCMLSVEVVISWGL